MPPAALRRSVLRSPRLILPALFAASLATLLFFVVDEPAPPVPIELAPTPRYSGLDAGTTGLVGDGLVSRPIQLLVEPGQTPSELFEDLGLEGPAAYAATAALIEHVDPRRLKAGQVYAAYFTESAAGAPARDLRAFEVRTAATDDRPPGLLRVDRQAGRWTSSWRELVREERIRFLSGELESSLQAALSGEGAPASLAYRMSDALQWDLDFSRDLRVRDRFRVLYREIFLDGELTSGEILALVYENRGQVYEAYAYQDGFYDAEGRPMKKLFLRSPLEFSRVTSGFSHRRFHPVLKRYRPHYGVDYGARTGTPVRVTASGSVTFAGWNGGAGRMVRVRHPNGYETSYLHLSRFARGIRPGSALRQGDTIGYVGATGLATAPHLDYRVRYKGKWINPLSLKSVPAKPLDEHEIGAFREHRDHLRAALAAGSPEPFTSAAPAVEVAERSARPAAPSATAGQ